MNDSDIKELERKKTKLLNGMTEYMSGGNADVKSEAAELSRFWFSEDVRGGDKAFDAGYTAEDVKKCDKILREFTDSLQKLGVAASQSQILECVKSAILNLNKLNESVDGCLIETEQREELFEFIDFAARRSGLQTKEADITEQWREW
ncbi:MAG: hypothetical protein NTZ16_11235 [Verrucomicrobia bacterium]|nr:hypothetical protein [Verrucomicrobiota bacterium]